MFSRLLLLCFLSINISGYSQVKSELERSLFLMEDVIFERLDKSPDGYKESFKVMIKQPLDHANPAAGSFFQKVYINHKSFDAPNVLVTEGYERPRNRLYELSAFMQANQIQVEHRYYGESVPEDDPDYTYLNLQQATADYHRINEMFRQIYSNVFLCTGISKGGMTTLFYSYLHPDDMDVYIPYVAPINVEYKDKRIYDFLDNVGTKKCRKAITDFQKHMLKQKESYIPLMKWHEIGAKNKYEVVGIEKAYEYAVLEYSFSFWQFGHDCGSIPDVKTASEDKILEHFLSVSGLSFFSDKSINGYSSFYYQMGTEMGYYGYSTDDFNGLISYVGEEPSAVFVAKELNAKFDPSLTIAANNYFESELDRVIYINGGIDTWSATAVTPNKSLDAVVFNLEGKHHGSARIRSMNDEERKLFETTLERWLKIDVPSNFE